MQTGKYRYGVLSLRADFFVLTGKYVVDFHGGGVV